MTITTTLTDGTTSIDLVYNSVSQANYKQVYGAQVQSRLPVVLQHQPDYGAPTPIDAWDNDRQVFLTMDVIGDDWDEILNKIATLKRLVDGASSQALRYWTVGDVNRVSLQLSVGQTNTTNIPVKFGLVDDSEAYYRGEAYLNGRARLVVVSLVVSPYGEGAAIELANDLANPAFTLEGTTSGLAAGWVEGGTPTVSLSTTTYLIGGQSQKVDTTTLEDGVYSVGIVANSTKVAGYIWVLPGTNQRIRVGLYNLTLVDTHVSVTINVGASQDVSAADMSLVDNNGDTWYRVPISTDTWPSGDTVQIYARYYLATGTPSGTFYMDAAYMEIGTDIVPNAWASCKNIQNRNDYDSTNYDRINFVDVWGVPGDADAILNTYLATGGTGNAKRIITSQIRDGVVLVNNVPYWQESDDFTGTLGSWSAGTGTSANHYLRFTSAASPGRAAASVLWTGFNYGACRVFGICRSNDATTVSSLILATSDSTTGGVTLYAGTEVKFGAANNWEVLDYGLLNFKDIVLSGQSLSLEIDVTAANTKTFDIDAVLILPVNENNNFLFCQINNYAGAPAVQFSFDIYGTTKLVRESANDLIQNHLGGFWYVASGTKVSRNIVIYSDDDSTFNLSITATVTLSITPRSRHLLGTQ